MVRTQIYLDEAQKRALARLSAERGVSVAQLIRAAVDQLLEVERARAREFDVALDRTFGIWEGHKDIEDAESFVRAVRQGWVKRTER